MKFIHLFILALVTSSVISTLLFANVGSVNLIVFGYLVETSASSLLALIIILILTIYLSLQAFLWLIHLPKNWYTKRNYRLHIRSEEKLSKALLSIELGQLKHAERLLIESSKHNAGSLINYLKLAQISHAEKKYDKANKYIAQAKIFFVEETDIIQFIEADLNKHNDPKKSNEILTMLLLRQPKHPKILQLKAHNHFVLQQFEQLGNMLPILEKYKAIDYQLLLQYQEKTSIHSITLARDFERLQKYWLKLKGSVHRKPKVMLAYVQKRIEFNVITGLMHELKKILPTTLDDGLLELWATVDEDKDLQLRQAEKWYSQNKTNPKLIQTCGRLCIALELWGKALDYLKMAYAKKASPEIQALILLCYKKLGLTHEIEKIYMSIQSEQLAILAPKPITTPK